MLTALLLSLLAQTPESVVAPAPAPPDESKFSESFRRQRAKERERLRPSWTDEIAFAAAAYGSAHFFSAPLSPVTAAPAITIDLEFGAHLIPLIALVGTAQVRPVFLQPGTEAIIGGLGGAVRIGQRFSVSVGGGITALQVLRVTTTSVSALAHHFELHGVFGLTGVFGLHVRSGMVFVPGGPIVDVGVGFGFST
jgi:hypothetical protein